MKVYNYLNTYLKLNTDDEEIIKFGLEIIIEILIAIITIIMVSVISGMIIETILFLLFLIPLRQNAGGYHTKSRICCGILSLFILIVVLTIISNFNINRMIQFLICFISTNIIFFLSPVDNNNNKLDNLEKKVYASRTKKILLFELLGFMLLVILNYSYWSCVLMISIFITAILVLAGYLQNRMEKN